jgi:RNA 2',3'-cyclic 3'-phosphodiesterase
LRLFFALWPEADAAMRLTRIAASLNLKTPGRLVDSKNYHVTLAFIGEVAESRLAVLQQIGGSLHAPRCTLTLDSLEFWPQSRVVVATARETPPGMLSLWAQLHEAADLPRARLRMHVTLARKVAQPPVMQAISPVLWRATRFSLVRSETNGVESAYTVLDTWPLLDKPENP